MLILTIPTKKKLFKKIHFPYDLLFLVKKRLIEEKFYFNLKSTYPV